MSHRRIPVIGAADGHRVRQPTPSSSSSICVQSLSSSSQVMLSSRRDPAIRLHRLRPADEVTEIRAGDV